MISFLKKIYSFNSSRFRLEKVNGEFAEIMEKDSLVLDAGAGDQPYRNLLSHVKYESADFEKVDKEFAQSTYVCDLKVIPVENNRYDYILFNQVMEHLPNPSIVLEELYRVLKPGGKMIYTGPLFYEEHEIPYDFYRYTQFSLQKLFTEAGFKIESVEWLEGYFGTIGYQLNRMSSYLPLLPKKIGLGLINFIIVPLFFIIKIFSGLFSILFHWLETKVKYTAKGYPKNYVSILVKPI